MVAFEIVLAGACGHSPAAAPSSDGGGDVSEDGHTDLRRDPIVTPPNCLSARTVCDGQTVRACVGNQPKGALQICGETEACSLGRCTTPACEKAERLNGASGCRFYGVQSDNIDSDDSQDVMLIFTSASDQPTPVRVEMRQPGGRWEMLATAQVDVGGGGTVRFSRPVRDPGVVLAGAYRVDSDAPVFAVQIVSDDQNRDGHSSAGTVLRPVQALGFRHLAVTAPAAPTADVLGTPGSRGGAGAITVVATENATTVSIRPTSPASILPGGPNDPLPSVFDVQMGEGDVFQMFSATAGGDLTGTAIDANAPVAVFSGNIYTTYGYAITGFNGGDLTQEQLPPTSSWGREYVGARLSPQAGCDPLFGKGAGLWRVVAAANATKVELVPARGAVLDGGNLPPDLRFTLQQGESRTFFARPDGGRSSVGDFLVRAEQPILLAQSLDCEPGLSWGIDTRLTRTDGLGITLPPGFDHEMVVVRRRGVPLTFDGYDIPEAAFDVLIEAGGGFELARLKAADLIRCADQPDGCNHHLAGAAFGVTWRGMDVVCSYSLTAPPADLCALPNVNCEP
ncbi:MAG: hypothetical protein ABUS79_07065 [Pseudomonadota bacterium]